VLKIAGSLYGGTRALLEADAFDRVRRTNSALFQALLAYVGTVMAERLSFANRAIEAPQR
jgi:hypothetical protein